MDILQKIRFGAYIVARANVLIADPAIPCTPKKPRPRMWTIFSPASLGFEPYIPGFVAQRTAHRASIVRIVVTVLSRDLLRAHLDPYEP